MRRDQYYPFLAECHLKLFTDTIRTRDLPLLKPTLYHSSMPMVTTEIKLPAPSQGGTLVLFAFSLVEPNMFKHPAVIITMPRVRVRPCTYTDDINGLACVHVLCRFTVRLSSSDLYAYFNLQTRVIRRTILLRSLIRLLQKS